MSHLELSLLALGLAIPGLLLYRYYQRPATASGTQPFSVDAQNRPVSATSSSSDTHLLRGFFELVLVPRTQGANPNQLLTSFADNWQQWLEDSSIFPRQPMILPRLLQAMRSDSNSEAIVEIVLEDPGLTAEVLKLANSPIYRNTKGKVQSIDYALVMLGIEGLHSLVCSTLAKPIFAKQRGDGFSASLFWEWSIFSAQNAQHLARLNQLPDPATLYMLALLTRLAELTCLRIATRLSKSLGIQINAATVLEILDRYRQPIASQLITAWGFDEQWQALLPNKERVMNADPGTELQRIYRCQRVAPEVSSAALLMQQRKLEASAASQHLQSLGLASRTIRELTQTT
ncbi:MAG: HDOD domain-containing protein [Pseudomonadales bacterium]